MSPSEFPFRIEQRDEHGRSLQLIATTPDPASARSTYRLFAEQRLDWRVVLLQDGHVIKDSQGSADPPD